MHALGPPAFPLPLSLCPFCGFSCHLSSLRTQSLFSLNIMCQFLGLTKQLRTWRNPGNCNQPNRSCRAKTPQKDMIRNVAGEQYRERSTPLDPQDPVPSEPPERKKEPREGRRPPSRRSPGKGNKGRLRVDGTMAIGFFLVPIGSGQVIKSFTLKFVRRERSVEFTRIGLRWRWS